jgi:hypothetical protein
MMNTLKERRLTHLAKPEIQQDVAEKFEECLRLQLQFWNAVSNLEDVLGMDLDDADHSVYIEMTVGQLLAETAELADDENLCPVYGAGPGGVCECVHPREED